jgi:RNA polymerase sigma-70 factor (ECF subfamily)
MNEPAPSATDPRLLSRVGKDLADAAAWSEFVDRYGPRVHAWCRRWGLQGVDAEEVTQIVLVKLAGKMRTFVYDPRRSFRAWLKTVAHHAWRDFVDGQIRPGLGAGDSRVQRRLEQLEAREDLLQHLDEEFERELLREAMARVRERVEGKTWEAFQRLTFQQQSGREVAGALDMALGAVFMAKKRVQTMLTEEVARLQGSDSETEV